MTSPLEAGEYRRIMHPPQNVLLRRPGTVPFRLVILLCGAVTLLPVLLTPPSAAQRRRPTQPGRRNPGSPPAATPTPPPPPCPVVEVTCRKKEVRVGDPLIFEAKIKGQISGTNPQYSWEVEPPSLTPRDNTGPTLTIDTSKAAADSTIVATVTVSDLGPGCAPQSRPSCPVTVKAGTKATSRLTEFPAGVSDTVIESQLVQAVQELKSRPDAVLYLVTHEARRGRGEDRADGGMQYPVVQEGGGPFAGAIFGGFALGSQAGAQSSPSGAQDTATRPLQSGGSALEAAQRAKRYLVRQGIEEERVIITPGLPRCEPAVEVYLAPRGDSPPVGTADVGPCRDRGEEIDLLWTVQPPSIVGDFFGKRVRERFYVIQVFIRNNSASEFQLTGFGFSPGLPRSSGLPARTAPPSDRDAVRGTILKEQRDGLRGRTAKVLQSTGTLLTGFIPFFRADSRRADFAHFTSIFSNPLEMGFDLFFPDKTNLHLSNLDESVWRGGSSYVVSIPSLGTYKTYLFYPKELLALPPPTRDNPQAVRNQLSQLIMLGSTIERVNIITKVQP